MICLACNGNFDTGALLHPNQALLFFTFEAALHAVPEYHHSSYNPPVGYHPFARFFNTVPAEQYKWCLAEYHPSIHAWVMPTHQVIPGFIFTKFFDRTHYSMLMTMGILMTDGDIDQHKLCLIQIAMDCPFDNIHRHNTYYQQWEGKCHAAQQASGALYGFGGYSTHIPADEGFDMIFVGSIQQATIPPPPEPNHPPP
ncbi:hypothetical protein C0995_012010 [Termitomyces sp. Mi166|nr:hypothetical protein C0995_012010 [Termitomyces sp. Mi166\